MDTVILGLLLLVLVLLILLLASLYYLVKFPRKPKNQSQSQMDSLLRLHQEQILENRRLVNILISKTPMEFQAMTSVNPENLGTSPITNPPQTFSGSKDSSDYAWDGEGIPADEGFDALPNR